MGVKVISRDDPARLARVLDAKTRTIGIDRAALDHLAAVKASRAAAEAARDRSYAVKAEQAAATAEAAQAAAAAAWRESERRTAAFRAERQAASGRREWDLQRHDALRTASPARVGDDDPRAGPASLQRFAGEDLDGARRRAAAGEADRKYWDAQQAAREAQAAADRAEADVIVARLRQQESAQRAATAADAAARAAAERQVAAANGAAAAANAAAAAADRRAAAAAADAEAAAVAASGLLNEDPSLGRSAADLHRVRPDHWKGMSAEQRAVFPLWQLQQMEAKAARQQAVEQADHDFAVRQQEAARGIDHRAHLAEAARAEAGRRVGETWQAQAVEKERRDAVLKQLYDDNCATPEYFAQFQTSHR